MKFASQLVKVLFLMGLSSVSALEYSDSASSLFLDETRSTTANGSSKMLKVNVKKGSKSKFGGLLPSDIRSEVSAQQLIDYGHQSIGELRDKINSDKSKQHFTEATSLISDDPEFISKKLQDFRDVQIFTEMYVGSNRQPFDVIFDTGSNWFWVQSSKCSNCPSDISFDESSSDTLKMSKMQKSLYYGSGSVTGTLAKDTVCLTENSDDHCVPDFRFIDVTSQSGLDMLQTSGLVGLSPKRMEHNADLFVEKMKQGGAIEDAIFSMSIAPGDKQSIITFGGFSEEDYATGPLKWHSIDPYSNYWILKMNRFNFGDGQGNLSGFQINHR